MVTFCLQELVDSTAQSEVTMEVINAINAQKDADHATLMLTAEPATLDSSCILVHADQLAQLVPSPSPTVSVLPVVNLALLV